MSNRDDEAQATRLGTLEANIGEIFRQLDDMKKTRAEMSFNLSSTLDKLDNRMRAVERYLWIGIGSLGALQVLIAFLKK